MRVTTFFLKIALALMAYCHMATAQSPASNAPKKLFKPLTFKLSEDGSRYFRLTFWHQFWVTSTDNNKGTLGADGQPVKGDTYDIALRRTRLGLRVKLPRFFLYTNMGFNNQSFISGGIPGGGGKKPQIYVLDAWTEYAVIPQKLYAGVGLRYYGISRMTNPATSTLVGLDIPVLNFPSIEQTDQLARQLGVFIKGQLGLFDYRVSMTRPFAFGVLPELKGSNGQDLFGTTQVGGREETVSRYVLNGNFAHTGYFKWMFRDKEDNTTPYEIGTYLGSKDVFNIGMGYYYHPGALAALKAVGSDELRFYDQLNLGFDIYLDKPLPNKAVLSAYSVLYVNRMGPNFYRNLAILNNYAQGQSVAENPNTSATGFGNSSPAIGTGVVWYSQAGYMFPKFKGGGALMPYITHIYKSLEGIGSSSNQFDFGINYFIHGHNAKLSLQYSLRPTYVYDRTGSKQPDGHKGQLIFLAAMSI